MVFRPFLILRKITVIKRIFAKTNVLPKRNENILGLVLKKDYKNTDWCSCFAVIF